MDAKSHRHDTLRVSTLMSILNAAHLTYMVEAPAAYRDIRGGIMLVGPPSTLKTSVIKQALAGYSDKTFHTDLTTRQLVQMRSKIADSSIKTLAFEEFAKLYARTNAGAGDNIEKNIQALIEQGFSKASYEDQTLVTSTARALVIGGLVEPQYEKRWQGWVADGFARRWMWSHIIMDNKAILEDAVERWTEIDFNAVLAFSSPASGVIKYTRTKSEAGEIRELCKHQEGRAESARLLTKILCVLRWRFKESRKTDKSMDMIREFSRSLGSSPAKVVV
jgi:hypothetical protein